jgi:NADPH:quinone reductase-like Zn-dependent oxidoreductase
MSSPNQSDGLLSLPSTMRAWTYTRRGLPSEIVQLDTHFKAPSLSDVGPNHVLVKISYACMNGDVASIMQALPLQPLSFWPKKKKKNKQARVTIPELEFSGTVVAVGKKVRSARPDLQPGTLVLGGCRPTDYLRRGRGTLAEYTIAPAAWVAPIHPTAMDGEAGSPPLNLSLAEASGIGGVGSTAIQILDLSRLKTGDKVLINGGSSGSGVMMIQVARHVVGNTGCIVATCSAANAELIKSLGADEVIDYRQHHPLHEYLRASPHSQQPFDAIIDCIGVQDLYTHSPAYLARGEKKRYLNIGALTATPSLAGLLLWGWRQFSNRFWPAVLGGVPRPYRFHSATPDIKTLNRVRQLVAEGKLKQVVDSIWEMEDVPKVR